MPPAKKRKTRASAKKEEEAEKAEAATVDQPAPTEPEPEKTINPEPEADATVTASEPADTTTAASSSTENDAAARAQERMARFKALQARAKTSAEKNHKEVTHEAQRLATDPNQLTAIRRKHAIASHKLLKADVEDAGGDFERKRAWDWTVDESEKWDKRMKKKDAHRDDNAFQDYRRESQKVYKRQLKNMAPDLERYTKDKLAAIEKAAAQGSLEIVETEDGEMIAVDKDGTFYSTADSTSFAENKPDKEAIDRLVNDMKKADAVAAKKRRERMAKNGDDADVTYINEKNKQFNQKLDRFYNKYTAEIRDSFERGTMI
ncbi:putative syf2 splicing factor protein [Phaeoacremonium minimum UCRPA7]|uniref:Pre-mRNA-splicing factor SYF2 n=1 Tax=Phaeoacremonium minimum (strain UCR-PA7) TaxID=1286976 RepID=R8BTY0_PHAM7|nr:putative syf2 splicing factor protein [Phaeoacremonium minimum UCRPA7]EOO02754.1 putative syf2 splicing factor protein [Phaeoacremonium minimum UCRPA7]